MSTRGAWRATEAAERLKHILETMDRAADRHQMSVVSAIDQLGYVGGRQSVDASLRRANIFRGLPLIIREQARLDGVSLPAAGDRALARLESLMLYESMGQPWKEWRRQLGSDVAVAIGDLRHSFRHGVAFAPRMSLDSIFRFRKLVSEALMEVPELGVPDNVEKTLADGLRMLLDAIDDYRISGNIGLNAALAASTSDLATIESEFGSIHVTSRLKKVLVSFAIAAAIVNMAATGVADLASLRDVLPWWHQREGASVIEIVPTQNGRVVISRPADGGTIIEVEGLPLGGIGESANNQ